MTMNLDEYKNNPKTAFLAQSYEKLLADEAETLALAEKDPSMKEMADHELISIHEQAAALKAQLDEIIAGDKEE